MIEDLKVRAFDPEKDFPGALQCWNEGFHHILWPFIEHASSDFHLDLVRVLHRVSQDCIVAEIDGEVHGVLFGAAPLRFGRIFRAMNFLFFHMVPKVIVNGYRFDSLAYKHLFQCLYGCAPWFILHPFRVPISEVTLFTSTKKYRGQGMGRDLMNTFVARVRERGLAGTSVCTDTSLSYRFYEIYGYRRERTFPMKAYKYSISNESFVGLIYYYPVKE